MSVDVGCTHYTSVRHLMDQHELFGGSCGKSKNIRNRCKNFMTQLAANTCHWMASAGITVGSSNTLHFPIVLGTGALSVKADGTPWQPDRHPQPPASTACAGKGKGRGKRKSAELT